MDPITIGYLIFAAIAMILAVSAYMMASKQQSSNITDSFEATTAEEGGTIHVVFGSCWEGNNVVYYGKVSSSAVKSSGGKK